MMRVVRVGEDEEMYYEGNKLFMSKVDGGRYQE